MPSTAGPPVPTSAERLERWVDEHRPDVALELACGAWPMAAASSRAQASAWQRIGMARGREDAGDRLREAEAAYAAALVEARRPLGTT